MQLRPLQIVEQYAQVLLQEQMLAVSVTIQY